MGAGCSLLRGVGLGAHLVFPRAWTWCDSTLTLAEEVCAGMLQAATTAPALLPKPVSGPCLGAALCWGCGVSTQPGNGSRFPCPLPLLTALPRWPPPSPRRHPLHDLELARGDMWHRGLAAVHLPWHNTWPWERSRIWSGKTQQGAFSTKRHEEIHHFFFFFSFFSSVKHPPKVNSMAINLIPCSGWLGKRLLVAALTLTERHSPVLAFSYSKSLKTQSS